MREMTVIYRKVLFACLLSLFLFGLSACGGGKENGVSSGGADSPAATGEYVVFAWNDLGMHCLNPTYDTAVILPPYNNLVAQVVQKGNPPRIVTGGLTVEYRILNNTYSSGKTDSFGAVFSQFWSNALAVFGINLTIDKGLNLVDAGVHNGLSGQMLAKGDHFAADGIPLTPVDDAGKWDPYQVAEINVKDASGKILATTRATVPTSDEINCQKCHGADPFNDLLQKHDQLHGTTLMAQKPVLCANCHGSPALGKTGPGTSGKYLSFAIHNSHASRGASCYDCHPGASTKCNRSIAHTTQDGNCTTCHGSMKQVADSIAGGRVPWVSEPTCLSCHNIIGVNTGSVLYRNAKGHGNLYCATCHGSPHAMVPTNQPSDNYQAIQYQGKAKSIGSCGACHRNSRGEGLSEFAEQHGGAAPKHRNACHICHTAVSSNTAAWPHAFQWKAR